MSANPPAFQFYPADFLSDENVALMSLTGRGAYITLLCYCWREGSIPADMTRMGRLCGLDSSAMAQLWPELIACFEIASDRYIQPRLQVEREKQIAHSKERQESGKRGAELRWNARKSKKTKPPSDNGSAIGQLIAEPLSDPIAKPIAKNGSSSLSSCINSEIDLSISGANAPKSNSVVSTEAPTGTKPPDVIWDLGVNILTKAGEKNEAARSFLGGLAKKHGKDKLAQALATTSAANPVNPKEYIVKVLQDSLNNQPRKAVF